MSSLPKLPTIKAAPVDLKPLTEKEGKDLQPKMLDMVKTLFRYADLGITTTNRAHQESRIWQSIDDSDCQVIADLVIDAGKKSRLVATGVRKLSLSYKMLQVGIITLPRFIQTYQFYAANGGFMLLAPRRQGGMEHANQNQRPIVSSRPEPGGTKVFSAPVVQEK